MDQIGHKGDQEHEYQDEEEDVGEIPKKSSSSLCDVARLCGWPSSRIVRVSRASGGKDRHSKVWTSKGLRDRRVRLSVNTAIQFYDLQDRLGYDQPSKAVEWLLKAAAPSIAELPPLEAFPDTLQLSDEKRSSAGTEPGFDSADVEMDNDDQDYHHQHHHQQQQHSSNSETSKGSGLSLSRSESRIKARERAKGRAVEKEKEKENESCNAAHHQNMHPSSSFTELLTGGMSNNNNNNSSPNGSVHQNTPRQWSNNPLEYFTSGLLGPSTTNNSTGYSGQFHPLQPMFSVTGDHHPELQHFPFVGGDNLVVPVVTTIGGNNGNEYNLNFSISSSSSSSASSFAGFNRGTLQSNSSSASPSIMPPHFQRFSPVDGSQSLFLGTTNSAAAASAYDARLQLFYGNGHGHGNRHSDQKGKGKN